MGMALKIVDGARVWEVDNGLTPEQKAASARKVKSDRAAKEKKTREAFQLRQAQDKRRFKPKPKRRIKQKVTHAPIEGFYDSRAWLDLRYRVLAKYGSTCQCCGASRKTGATMHIDHIKPRSLFPQLELDFDNLQVLCSECNIGKSNIDATDWR
jgi:5-methylcytosine-specific restriction endonuclease McrA